MNRFPSSCLSFLSFITLSSTYCLWSPTKLCNLSHAHPDGQPSQVRLLYGRATFYHFGPNPALAADALASRILLFGINVRSMTSIGRVLSAAQVKKIPTPACQCWEGCLNFEAAVAWSNWVSVPVLWRKLSQATTPLGAQKSLPREFSLPLIKIGWVAPSLPQVCLRWLAAMWLPSVRLEVATVLWIS